MKHTRVILAITAFLVFMLDRVSKLVIVNKMAAGQSTEIVPNIFNLTLVLNKGAAFGLFKERQLFFIIFSIAIIVGIIVYVARHRIANLILSLSLGLIAGGAIGNLVDRIKFGYVIDFLDFRIWPVFNFADSSITIGSILLALCILFS